MKRIKVLVLVLAFAFAAMGGAYAMWYDSLFVKAQVNTGVVDLTWDCAASDDVGPNYLPSGDVFSGLVDRLDPENTDNDHKNVGSLDIEGLSNDDETLPPLAAGVTEVRNINDVLSFFITNGYPGYQQSAYARIKNVGTVPTKFDSLTSAGIPSWVHVQVRAKDGDAILWDSRDASKTAYKGIQIDPGKTYCVRIVTRILQSAPQKVCNAQFTLKIRGIQWNEYGFPLPNGITDGGLSNVPTECTCGHTPCTCQGVQ